MKQETSIRLLQMESNARYNEQKGKKMESVKYVLAIEEAKGGKFYISIICENSHRELEKDIKALISISKENECNLVDEHIKVTIELDMWTKKIILPKQLSPFLECIFRDINKKAQEYSHKNPGAVLINGDIKSIRKADQ